MIRDVEGECNAHLYIGDDYGDNSATMRCCLPSGHRGSHTEVFRGGGATVTWILDERCYHNCPAFLDEITGEWYCSRCFIGEREFCTTESDETRGT